MRIRRQPACSPTQDCRLYACFATNKNGILLHRWGDYAEKGHNSNKALKALVNELGFGYIKDDFRYSIIENFNARVDGDRIPQSDAYWKKAFYFRKFGCGNQIECRKDASSKRNQK